MTFVTAGLAIAGLAGIAIPILIHLLARQRRRPIRWAAMRFLLDAYRKHRRRLRLEQFILLAVRCLIVAVLGLALARPLLTAAGVLDLGGSRAVYLIIDNGLASGLVLDEGRTALQSHVERARSLIAALEPGDFVGLMTASAPARALVAPPSSDHGAVLDLIESLESSESATDIGGAVRLLHTALQERPDERQSTIVYLLSEFRAGSALLEEPLPDVFETLPEDLTLLAIAPAAEARENVQIVAIDPVRSVVLPGVADGSGQVKVRLARTGGELPSEVSRVRLGGEGVSLIEPRVVSWQPGQPDAEVDFVLSFSTLGERQLALRAAIDEDRLEADNTRHAVLESRERIRVLLVDRRSFGFEPATDQLSSGQWIARALEPGGESPMAVVEVEPAALDAPDLRRTDVAIVPRPDLLADRGWSLLRQFVDGGGLLVVTPPPDQTVHQWTDRLAQDLSLPWRLALETLHPPQPLTLADEQPGGPILRLVSSELSALTRPIIVDRVLPLDQAQTQADTVLQFDGGAPALIVGSPRSNGGEGAAAPASAPGSGLVAYLAVAPHLSWTNLPTKPLMVPLFHELIRQGVSEIRGARHALVGATRLGALPAAARSLVDERGARVGLDAMGRPESPLQRAGVWTVQDGAGQELGLLAVNVEPSCGRTDVQSSAAVGAWLAESAPWKVLAEDELADVLRVAQTSSPMARLLLLTLIALVALETLVARWFSHAFQSRSSGVPLEAGRLAVGGVR